jgi:hypothetical protein
MRNTMDMGGFSPVQFYGIGMGCILATLRLWVIFFSRQLSDTYHISKRCYQEDCTFE